jgi:hypothetical protein
MVKVHDLTPLWVGQVDNLGLGACGASRIVSTEL